MFDICKMKIFWATFILIIGIVYIVSFFNGIIMILDFQLRVVCFYVTLVHSAFN